MKKIKDLSKLQPRARIYMEKKKDNIWVNREYMSWISRCASHYKDKIGSDTILDHDDFNNFLKECSLDIKFKEVK